MKNIIDKCADSFLKIPKWKQKIVTNWKKRHGAATFDFKDKEIVLYNGGLVYIDKYKYLSHKIVGKKKFPNGIIQILFSKKRNIPREDYYADLWFEELDDTIRNLKSMKRMLNKIGFKTNYKKNS